MNNDSSFSLFPILLTQAITSAKKTTISEHYAQIVQAPIYIVRVMTGHHQKEQRTILIQKFNNPTSVLKILIITYNIASVGLNLHEACALPFYPLPATWGHEAQAFGRCLRIHFLFNLKVFRIFHNGMIDSAMRDKRKTLVFSQQSMRGIQQLNLWLLLKPPQQLRLKFRGGKRV
ncbi:DNA/RNA helicase, C-terminal [Penicillium camemberti]|uniref:DNA/RNA helicase, C-terminal n=1 Tax=Penicillium camemberti (strain FM 013) TaxID=1429867 RepID=A0A0G4NX32_PENC3|nr:DNA/RNA helicase, C-terminal [Penicillium camemberti]